MNIQQLDLNLLLVFDAVYKERSISKAAARLDLSQPAVSNALKRLRQFTGDNLFFRAGNAMVPTRAANALAVPVAHALRTVEESLSSLRAFDPATSTRLFKLTINDFLRVTLVPPLTNFLEREAPGIKVEYQARTGTAAAHLDALRRRQTEMSMLPRSAVEGLEEISYLPVTTDGLQLAVRAGHPLLAAPVTKEALAGARYVATNNAPFVRAIVDGAFKAEGIERNITCFVPDTTTIPSIVEMTDLIGVIGQNSLARHQRDHALVKLPAPFTFPQIEAGFVWLREADEDQGLQWLRDKAAQILQTALAVHPQDAVPEN